MKAGKIPEIVLKRSVLRQLKTTRPEVLTGPRVGEDCGVLELGPDEVFVCTTDPVRPDRKSTRLNSSHW